ncbi:MAG: hypothetical protein RR784_00045 [Burkholderiaceae bacterium]
MDLVRLAVFVLGVALIVLYFRSISVAALLAQRRNDAVLRAVSWGVRMALRPRRDASFEQIQSRMDWFMPLQVLLTVVVWFSWLTLAFACLYWASGSVSNLGDALVASGSALSTLGFFTPDNRVGHWLAITEGMLGLIAVVYFFTFVPGFLAALQARANQVGWVAARAGQPPSAAQLLLWMHSPGAANDWPALWSSSEQWFRQLAITHSAAPELMYMPSFIRGHSWTATAGCLLEAAAFASAALRPDHIINAHVSLKIGSAAINDLAAALGKHNATIDCNATDSTTLDLEFDALWDRLAANAAPLVPDRVSARIRWHESRRGWTHALAAIAAEISAPAGLGLLVGQDKSR